MSRIVLRLLVSSFFVFLLTPLVVFGQNTAELCRAFVNEAFRDLGTNCANLATNNLCYGFGNFGEVTSTFYVDGQTQVVQADVFNEPSVRISLINQSELVIVESISTEAFVLDRDNDGVDEDRWGVAVQEVGANLPLQLPQNTAVLILFGGSRIENGVLPQNALILPNDPVHVVANGNISVFGSPAGLAYLVPSVQVGQAAGDLQADGISPDGQWVRIFFRYERHFGERASAWVKVSDLAESAGIASLPVIGPDTYTPMQKLYLRNSFNDPECADVPAPGLLIQGPDEIETDFTVNNLPLRVTSTAFLEQISAQRMRVTSVSGITLLFPDTDRQEVIPPGFTRYICLTEAQNLGIDGSANDHAIQVNCPEGRPDVLSRNDFGLLSTFAGLPANILNYSISNLGLACPSGVGSPTCTIQLTPQTSARIQGLCAEREISATDCLKYGF